MLGMVVFFIAFRWIRLSTPLIRLFLLLLILVLMLALSFLPVLFCLSVLLFVLPSSVPMLFILCIVVMMFFFIAFRWIHLSTPLIRLFLLVLILLLMPTLNFLPVWFALSLLRFRLPSRLPMMFILWMVAMMVVIIPSRTV